MLESITEVIKYTVPALVVFVTVYYLQKAFYQNEVMKKSMEIGSKKERDRLFHQKIQSYERLSLLCDRLRVPQLVQRLKTKNSTAKDLAFAMKVAIQKEMDHNATQQIYVSHKLWEIITLASQQNQRLIDNALEECPELDSQEKFISSIFSNLQGLEFDPLERAQYAIREEVKLLS